MLWSCADFPLKYRERFLIQAKVHKPARPKNFLLLENIKKPHAIFWAEAENRPSPQKEALQIRAAEAVLQPETKTTGPTIFKRGR